jgi:hypothetical protein
VDGERVCGHALRLGGSAWLKPFSEPGATALAVQRVGGTDHLDFDHVGVLAFQFVQDPIDYETRTHHTNMDMLESLQEADLQQAAAIVATFVYQTAMRDEILPRVALPKAPQFQPAAAFTMGRTR